MNKTLIKLSMVLWLAVACLTFVFGYRSGKIAADRWYYQQGVRTQNIQAGGQAYCFPVAQYDKGQLGVMEIECTNVWMEREQLGHGAFKDGLPYDGFR